MTTSWSRVFPSVYSRTYLVPWPSQPPVHLPVHPSVPLPRDLLMGRLPTGILLVWLPDPLLRRPSSCWYHPDSNWPLCPNSQESESRVIELKHEPVTIVPHFFTNFKEVPTQRRIGDSPGNSVETTLITSSFSSMITSVWFGLLSLSDWYTRSSRYTQIPSRFPYSDLYNTYFVD